ncbi:transcriptional activator FtrA [compost metagenome]
MRAIRESKGDIRLTQLEELTGYSCRTLQRQFQTDMGMSPKAFSRIVRCQSAIHEINRQERVIFSELACDLGFSDQPHFLREFKKLVSTTPLNYQRRVQQSAYLTRIRCS